MKFLPMHPRKIVPTMGDIRIGISGWTYAGWRGKFYPRNLPHERELAYAANVFRSIEINGTFYSLQTPDTFARWADAVPDDFIFSLKGPRYITHILRLRGVRVALANFLASGPLRLRAKLGPILWQLPPNFHYDAKRIEAFLKLLPRDTQAAAALARRHDTKLRRGTWTKTDAPRPLRHCLEIRHDSFLVPGFIALLRRYRVALVCADAVEWPRRMDLTSDFIYCRLHGSEQLYASGYDNRALDAWAIRALAWAQGGEPQDAERVSPKPGPRRSSRDVFLYFDNDVKVRAPADAEHLMERIRRGSGLALRASA